MDVIFARFDEVMQTAWDRLRSVRIEDVGSTFAARSERDSFATFYEDTIEQLRVHENKLIFGKVGYDDTRDFASYYIGRLGVQSAEHEPLLIDWRSSIGGDFYGATNQNPKHVQLRRHIMLREREVVGLEDEVLQYVEGGDGSQVIGEGALFAAMQAVRTEHMRDIVATIQKEQDEIIRAPLEGALVIQGGPGTGKTAVALHRIAYLLYQNRDSLSQSDILFLGPSPQFLTYVHRVLPSLGEVGVKMLRLADFWTEVPVQREASTLEQKVKGSAEMANVIKRAVSGYITRLKEDVSIFVSGSKVLIRKSLVQSLIAQAKRLHKQYNPARRYFVKEALEQILQEWIAAQREELSPSDIDFMRTDIEAHPEIRRLLGALWMPLDAPTLVARLHLNSKRFEHAFSKYFSEETVEELRAETLQFVDTSAREYAFSDADIALVDEAYALIGDAIEVQSKQRSEKDMQYIAEVLEGVAFEAKGIVTKEILEERIFGEDAPEALHRRRFKHIVVDEAQELSAMELRMVARMSSTGSYTLVGDIFQTTSSAGVHSWAALEQTLREVEVRDLTINYRNPQEIATLAWEYASKRGMPVPQTKAPRQKADSVRFVAPTGVLDAFAALPEDERTAVIAPLSTLEAVKQQFEGARNTENVQFFTPREAKGLEFEHVVLLDEAKMSAPDLFVAMTRSTSTITIAN